MNLLNLLKGAYKRLSSGSAEYNGISELVDDMFTGMKQFEGGTNGTYSKVFGDDKFVYKVFYDRDDYKGIKTAKGSFEREIYNTQLLEKYGLNVPKIVDAKKIKTKAGDVYIITKERIEGENLEDYLKDTNTPESKKRDAVLKAVDYMSKIHDIPSRKAKRQKGLETLVKDRGLIPYLEGEESSTIIFDPRLSNFVYNSKTNEVYLVDTETITKGTPYQDIGWLLGDLSEIAIYNPKLLEMEGLVMAKFLAKHPAKSLADGVKKIEQFKDNYFKMPRESKLEAYKMLIDDTDLKKDEVILPISYSEIGEFEYTKDDMTRTNLGEVSIPKGLIKTTKEKALEILA